ncbi:MAG TPA: hypothetical protein VJN69_11530 [Candidatus Acidoferrales bacterium]|nr:hypothetical protein [Candidatus Acidoferrales bacterium]
MPLEANPPLVIDANAVLVVTVASQGFEAVPRQRRKITKRRSGLHAVQLEACAAFKA